MFSEAIITFDLQFLFDLMWMVKFSALGNFLSSFVLRWSVQKDGMWLVVIDDTLADLSSVRY